MKEFNNPKISIITIVYNGVDKIEKTIQSVIKQDYQNVEYIVVNGMSTDGTGEIVEKYKSNIDKYICEEDSGISNAFNKGIMAATGDWIGIVNCGDYLCEGDLTKVSTELMSISMNYKILRCGINVVYKNNEKVLRLPTLKYSMYPHQFRPCHMGCYIESSTLKAYKYDENYKIAMDVELLYRMHRDNILETSTKLVIGEFILGGVSVYNPKRKAAELIEIALANGLNGYRLAIYKRYIYVRQTVAYYQKKFRLRKRNEN